jgi:NitT/TauT family transport system ATP-binding protein
MEIDDLFPLGETLQLLRLADFADADIKLTPIGQRFVDSDVDQRKKLIGEQLVANIPLAAHIKRVLDERPSHRAPATRFREELEDYMSEDYAERTLRTVINLGRYGEVFSYDENAQAFSYENPQ